MELDKLVRDKIPSLVTKDGGSYSLQLLSPLEHQTEITKKLIEEVNEYSEATNREKSLDELVDIVELAYSAAALHGLSQQQFEELRLQKKQLKGGFQKGIYLKTISY